MKIYKISKEEEDDIMRALDNGGQLLYNNADMIKNKKTVNPPKEYIRTKSPQTQQNSDVLFTTSESK